MSLNNVQQSAAEVADFSPYQIHSRREIISLLRSLQDKNQLVSLLINGGKEAVVTSILHVDDVDNTVIIDGAPTNLLNERIVESDNISFETVLDHIRILFFTEQIKRCTYDNLPALQFTLPDTMVRLQRRDFYRVSTPVINPIRCAVQMTDEDHKPTTTVPVTLQNISAGGIAIVDEKKLLDNTIGKVYKNCRIDLPGGSPVMADLEIRNSQELTFASGKSIRRLGCMFVNLPRPMLAAVQRYITKLEREQNARATGMR
jgi:c-di-GMP-binding flagellar brake protein YcgR